jgi:hypothetical protein
MDPEPDHKDVEQTEIMLAVGFLSGIFSPDRDDF